ncbi:SMC-Scp complex subunit ScpB [bacterium]|nr:SMC-Scp complex subunit ScpB [bacterium]
MNEEKLALLEAALFITDKPLTIDRLRKILRVRDDSKVLEMINELKRRYENESCGIEISEIGGYKLTVKPKFVHRVSKLTRHAELSRGLLRALSIIAYNEPVKQSDLVKVLGNRVYEYVKELIELGFISAEKKSRTRILRTTRLFEEYFGEQAKIIKEKGRSP